MQHWHALHSLHCNFGGTSSVPYYSQIDFPNDITLSNIGYEPTHQLRPYLRRLTRLIPVSLQLTRLSGPRNAGMANSKHESILPVFLKSLDGLFSNENSLAVECRFTHTDVLGESSKHVLWWYPKTLGTPSTIVFFTPGTETSLALWVCDIHVNPTALALQAIQV